MSNGVLPDYLSMAKPNPFSNRAPWYKNTAPTYAGIFLWFVFWSGVPGAGGAAGGLLSQGIGVALLGLVVSALICHFLFYLAMGLMGMKTGLPLYVVGSSTYGTQGGLFMPGFLMGILQFGWLAVNALFSSQALAPLFGVEANSPLIKVIMIVWALGAALIALKGIQYVAKVSTYLPLIPLAILIILFIKSFSGLNSFDAKAIVDAAPKDTAPALSFWGVMALSITYVVGFFATAGAAGVDFGSNSKDEKDVQMGGLFGVAGAIIVTAGLAILIVAGGFGIMKTHTLDPTKADFIKGVMGSDAWAKWFGVLLAIAALPAACFSSLIGANCFKTTLPKVNPFISVGIGAIVAAILAVTGYASNLISVFNVIGASFGPVCGAMTVEYFISGKKWSGPRKGWNMAGWISWIAGFIVGMLPLVSSVKIPAAPLAAFIVGAVLFFVLAKAGLQPPVIEMATASTEKK
jgi:cytosine permease